MILVYLLLVSSTMVFLAFTLTFVMRRSIANDWVTMSKPHILWANTAVLLLSSGMLELARRALKSGNRTAFNWWWSSATALGVLFLLGQGLAWQELKAAGLYMASNPSVSLMFGGIV